MKIDVVPVDGGKLPEYLHDGDSCMDCHARLPTGRVTLLAGKRAVIPLGFRIGLPEGYEAVIRPRSGLSKKGIDCPVGTIDSGYTGEVCAVLANNSGEDYAIENLARVCQMKVQRSENFALREVGSLPETARGSGGFGSTGV